MAMAKPTASEALVASFCGVWAAAALLPEGWAIALAPGFGVAVLPARRRPGLAGLLFVLVTLAASALGVPSDSTAALPAGFAVLFAAGRYATRAIGLAVVGACLVSVTVVDELSIANLLFGTFLFGSVYGFGVLIRRRTLGARAARAELTELAAEDPTGRAVAVVQEERSRLAGEALAVVRRAVERMRDQAARAETDLDETALAAVQESGREAVAELRRLLGLLRSDEHPAPASVPRPRRWLGAVVTALVLMGMCVVENGTSLDEAGPTSVALSLVVVGGASLRRFDLVAACLVASSGVLVAVVADIPLVYGAWDTAACALLVWTVAGDGRAKAYAAGALLMVLTVVDVHRHTSGNEAFLLAVFGISAVAGHLWAEREREERAARERAAGLRSHRDAIAAAAVREERLRLARELHDVVSHAIGVMVLQAGAAEALRESDPAAAREAVREVIIAGTGATSELEVLFGLVDAGAVGAAGVASPGTDDVVALVRRLRAGGLSIDLDLDGLGLPADAAIRSTAFRIVQEALTNAARHAPGAAIHIRLRPMGDRLLVEVDNDRSAGRPAGGFPVEGGFGLVGLAERVRALGGDLAAGPSRDGGFVVSARLPLTHEPVVP